MARTATRFYSFYVHHNDIFDLGEEVLSKSKARAGEVILYLVLLFVPIIPAALGFIKDGYGETTGWCWFKVRGSDCQPLVSGILRKLFLWYIWCVICGVVTLGFLCKIICTIRSDANQLSGTTESLANVFRKREAEGVLLLMYLGVFHAVNFTELAGAIVSYAVSDQNNLFPLWVIYAMLSPFIAAAIPTVYLVIMRCYHREEIRSPRCNRMRGCSEAAQLL